MEEAIKPSAKTLQNTSVSEEAYNKLYEQSLHDPDVFWGQVAQRLDWIRPPVKIKNASFEGDVSIKWFEDGILNVSYNCIDRHLPAKAGDPALIWESDNPDIDKKITYGELKREVCKLANALKTLGVAKGDRVIIYMPMIPETAYAMLACARIGAVHSVVFGGFSAQALQSRIEDCGANIVLTADEGVRGGKIIPLKKTVDEAVQDRACKVLVFRHTGGKIPWNAENDIWWHALLDQQSDDCPPEAMNAEDPLFILYTSGSTGKPKGVLHTTAGYLLYAAHTHEAVFDYKPGEIYWCTADVGWITGHSYIVYGPLANGAVSLMFEGVPTYPDASRFWQVIDKHKVNIFYTAPTAIRSLISAGDRWVKQTSRASLRILGSVGEPINHEAWLWYYNVVGEQRCPVIDTWWQTETGGHMIAPLASFPLKPGSAAKPFFGVKPEILDAQGHVLEGACEGALCISESWPGQARSLYGDHARFKQTYFSTYPGKYFTGDGARRDEDGYYWITGRIDDVINVSGHRLGTAEIESAINQHPDIAESAVVGFPHEIKGQGIYAFVTPVQGVNGTLDLQEAVVQIVRKIIGPIAAPDVIQFVPGLPKTRSGKIMRRVLKKIAAGEEDKLGDLSTLADPSVVETILKQRLL